MTLGWLVLVLAAVGGWGAAAGWALKRVARVELHGLRDILPAGVAVVLALAGVFVAFDAFSAAVVALLIAVGVVCALVELVRWALTDRAPAGSRVVSLAFGVVLIGLLLIVARYETATFGWNACDDDISYLYLAKRLTLDGNLLDPLNNRRLTSLGGMSALQALFLFRLPDSYLPVADLLLGSLLVLVGLWRTRLGTWSGWGIVAAFTVILFHGTLGVINTSPIILPIGLTIAAFLFATRLRADAGTPVAEVAVAVVLGLVVGAAATLRPQFLPPLGLLAAVAAAWPPLGLGVLRRVAGVGAGVLAATGGWMVASWRADGTPMFPLMDGNLDPAWPANGPTIGAPSVTALLHQVAGVLLDGPWWGLALLGVTYLAVVVVRGLDGDRAHVRWGVRMNVAAAAVCLVWLTALTYIWWSLGPPTGYPRFWAPLFLACVLLPIALVNGGGIRRGPATEAVGVAVVILAVVATGLTATTPKAVEDYVRGAATDTMSGRVGVLLHDDRYATRRDEYAQAVAEVPPGSKILAAVDVPSLLLSGGSDVDTIDLVGATSPPPYIPYFEGTQVKLTWLRVHGYRYIIAVDPNASACLYNRHIQELDLEGVYGPQYQAWAPYYFDWFQLLADVSSSPDSTRVGSLILVRL